LFISSNGNAAEDGSDEDRVIGVKRLDEFRSVPVVAAVNPLPLPKWGLAVLVVDCRRNRSGEGVPGALVLCCCC